MTTAPHLDSTKSVGRTFQSVKRLWCRQNDRPESRSHRSEEFFNRLLTRCPQSVTAISATPSALSVRSRDVRPVCRRQGSDRNPAFLRSNPE